MDAAAPRLHTIRGPSGRLPALRMGVGGPVGSGKTTRVEMPCEAMRERWELLVVSNDICTKEDQRLLTVAGVLDAERIMGGETGGCPHTAIREDTSINLEAVDRMLGHFPGITRSDLLVINEADLAPHVGADLAVMEADTLRMRGERPYVMTDLRTRAVSDAVVSFIGARGLLTA